MATVATKRGDGARVPHTAASAIVAGDVIVLTDMIGIAVHDIANGEDGHLDIEGVYSLPLKTDDTPTVGQIVFWDSGNSEITVTETDNIKAGVYIGDSDITDEVLVKINTGFDPAATS